MSKPVTKVKVSRRDAQWYAGKITDAWQKAVPAIIETGQWLIDAKRALDHGQWQRIFKDHSQPVADPIPFGSGTGQRLMKITAHCCLPKPAHGPVLPPSWRTLYEITHLDEDEFGLALKRKVIHPECQRKDIRTFIRELHPPSVSSETFDNRPTISCADWADWLKTIDECDLLLTDPPYSIDG